MKKLITGKALLVLQLIFLAGLFQSCGQTGLFTPEEQQWIAERKEPVTLAHMPHYAPFEFSDSNGEFTGITADYLDILTEITGLTFESQGEMFWTDLMEAGKNKEIDIILQMTDTPQRREFFLFTAPYISNDAVIIHNSTMTGKVTLEDLEGKRVLHPRGYAITGFLQKNYPQLDITLVRDDFTALRMVSEGQAEAALIDQTVASYLIRKHGLNNLKIGGETGFAYISSLAVRDDQPVLHSILDKALKMISPRKKRQLNEKWISLANQEKGQPRLSNHSRGIYAVYTFFVFLLISLLILSQILKKQQKIISRILTITMIVISLFSATLFLYTFLKNQENELKLTSVEQIYLQKMRGELFISVDTTFPPFEFIDDSGLYRGITADIIHLIEKKIGYSFHLNTELSWAESLEAAKRKEIDAISGIQKNEERSTYLSFTPPYLDIPNIIIVPETDLQTKTLDDLNGKTVSIVDDYEIETYLRNNYPEIIIKEVPDSLTALRLVSFQEVDASISPLATAVFLSRKENIINLKIAGDSGYTYHLRMGIIKDNPILLDILSKAILSITQDEKQQVLQNWLPINFTPQEISNNQMLLISASAFVISLIFLIILFWNYSLIQSVENRTHELNTSLKEKSLLLHEINHRLKNNLSVINSMLNIQRQNSVDKNVDKLLKQTQNRLESLSLVHEYLYESPQLHLIDFEEYSKQIVKNLVHAHCHNRPKPELVFDFSTKEDHIDVVRIAGLIVVEIVTNILKYAFPDGKEGRITISWQNPGQEKKRLIIEDNGIGFQMDPKSNSLGLKLVHELVKTTQGDIQISSGPWKGTRVEIILCVEAVKNRGSDLSLN